jgi:hypothetical protein
VKFKEVVLPNTLLGYAVEVVSPQGWIVRLQNTSEVHALSQVLPGSCRRHAVNPFDYLKDLFTRLPAAKITEIQQFTPVAWAKAQTVALAA